MKRGVFVASVPGAAMAGAATALIMSPQMLAPLTLQRMALFDVPRSLPAFALTDHAGRRFARDRRTIVAERH
jgi:hypothetical protein